MNHKRPPIPVIVLIVLAVLVGGYFIIRSLMDGGDGTLVASGTIEVVEVSIAPETGGRVAEVYVEEGDSVAAGDELFRLDDTLLQAQCDVAAAGLDTAEAAAATADAAVVTARTQYALTVDAARAEAAATRTADWRLANPIGYTQPGWYYTDLETIAAAQAEVDRARAIRDGAQDSLNFLLGGSANAGFLDAEARLIQARNALLTAQDTLQRASLAADNAELQDAAQAAYDAAQDELDEAQAAYDELAATDAGQAVVTARAELAVAEERYRSAQTRLLALETGDYSPRVAAAEAAVRQAEAAANQAHLAVAQAEANLALIDAQIARLTVVAPSDGVVLTRTIEPGEVVSPAAVSITLGRLDDTTITVYVPEDRYGEISLGQSATVTVDSFPDRTFEATVVYIAGQGEFTPRNVQTAEGRSSTVYAIRLRVEDPEGNLKPGMPADVTFER